jgi:hypothetical protein
MRSIIPSPLLLSILALGMCAFTTAPHPAENTSVVHEISTFWHGRSFVYRGSDGYGTTSSTIRFSTDGRTGALETSGVVLGSAYSGRNEFDVISSSTTEMTIRYTAASDRDLAPYIVGKKEFISLNAANRTITYNGNVHK